MNESSPHETELGVDRISRLSQFDRADRICDAYEREWLAGRQPGLEDFLSNVADAERDDLRRELEAIQGDYLARLKEAGRTPLVDETAHVTATKANRPDGTCPTRIGRYRVERLLGWGGFGQVYLADDEQLRRLVAIKVPNAELMSTAENLAVCLAEARTVASFDHPHIVPVYDVGATNDYPFYIVSKYVNGCNLATRIKTDRPGIRESVEIVAAVAEALDYAHRRGVVHRDIKPGNILIDGDGRSHLVDFGLALKEEDIGRGPKYLGTLAYMSPEQASGEGHRIDARSDIFSLGVVLYELLAGRRPFLGETQDELLALLIDCEAPPLADSVPAELDRICHKALAKQASQRYTSAKDLAGDLKDFLAVSVGHAVHAELEFPVRDARRDLRESTHVVPKGLRSFDAQDASFFLDLLPGPRDRDGLPDSVRFWKTRVEQTDSHHTCAVGLIYGPSGCGKSSLVKAGLLPRLSADVISVYAEATAEETESRLLHALRNKCPAVKDYRNLKETLIALRQGRGIPLGRKILIILDQLEQFLHARGHGENSELVQALRQCDGGRVQCVVMVRDDFWMAATRFLRELDLQLLEGDNALAVDLFPVRHAERVLAEFGRAFGALPAVGKLSKKHLEFLSQAVAGFMRDGKVVCIQLALFAEMMKDKAWTPASLKAVGGIAGVGVAFLDETFSAPSAHARHRRHEAAVREVLKGLLPDSGGDLKGQRRSYQELSNASGYARHQEDVDDLIRLLDQDLRLITPTDLEGSESAPATPHSPSSTVFYQLTHDYLVPSIRDWLTRRQLETRRGRAELRLAERAELWSSRPESRHLPSWWEYASIRCLTDKRSWTDRQRWMMRAAGRAHGFRTLVAGLLLAAVVVSGIGLRDAARTQQLRSAGELQAMEYKTRSEGWVQTLLNAEIAQVPVVVSEINRLRDWADPLLRIRLSDAPEGSTQKLHLALALLPVDEHQVEYLKDQLSTCTVSQFEVIRNALHPYHEYLEEGLWQLAEDDQQEPTSRFRAAAALARFDPEDVRWPGAAPFVAQQLTSEISTISFGQWLDHFRPASQQLTPALEAIYFEKAHSSTQRVAAALALAEYWRQAPDKLVDVLLMADEATAFSALIAALQPHAAVAEQRLTDVAHAAVPAELPVEQRNAHWQRQSRAVVALVHLGFGSDVWPLLKSSPDPSLQSQIIHDLGRFRTQPNTLAARLEQETDTSIRRALIQSLGRLDPATLAAADRKHIVQRLQTLAGDPDPGIHGSAAWALWKWGEQVPQLPPTARVSLTEQDEERLAELARELSDLQTRRLVYLTESRHEHQAAWEQQLQAKPHELPDSFREQLIAHFTFDETQGIEGRNAVPGASSGGNEGAETPGSGSGVIGDALRLDGSGEFVSAAPLSLAGDDAFSYGCWVYLTGETPAVLLSGRNVKPYEGFDLSVERGNRLQVIVSGESEAATVEEREAYTENYLQVQTGTQLQPERDPAWHHVFATYDGSKRATGVSIYLDGKPAPTVTLTDRMRRSVRWKDTPLIVGSRYGRYRSQAKIDDVRVYRRVLAREEVQQLFRLGIEALARSPVQRRSVDQVALLEAYYPTVDQALRQLDSRIAAVETALREEELTRKFGVLEAAISAGPRSGDRSWYINCQGQTMVVFRSSDEAGNRLFTHSFGISSREVTVDEFCRCVGTTWIDHTIAPTRDCPVHLVQWYQAVEYCNWLSGQEGIPQQHWVYEPNADGKYATGMRIRENYLELLGYRLPTIAEWEYACNAGSQGTYCFGEPLPLLENYAEYIVNSGGRSHPVGSLLPNAAGLFDMHGNVWEWTQDSADGTLSPVHDNLSRSLCGGAFYLDATVLRRDSRTLYVPAVRISNIGFRPVRSIRPTIKSELGAPAANNDEP